MGFAKLFTVALAIATATASAAGSDTTKTDSSPTQTRATRASTETPDWKALSSELASYVSEISIPPLFPKPTATFAIDIPASLQGPIITAVPPGILIKLLNTEYRQNVSSQMAAGHTPSWYKSIDPDVRNFLSDLNEDIKTNGTSIYSTIAETDKPSSTDVETSTSEDAAAPTRADHRFLAGLAGVAGLALAI